MSGPTAGVQLAVCLVLGQLVHPPKQWGFRRRRGRGEGGGLSMENGAVSTPGAGFCAVRGPRPGGPSESPPRPSRTGTAPWLLVRSLFCWCAFLRIPHIHAVVSLPDTLPRCGFCFREFCSRPGRFHWMWVFPVPSAARSSSHLPGQPASACHWSHRKRVNGSLNGVDIAAHTEKLQGTVEVRRLDDPGKDQDTETDTEVSVRASVTRSGQRSTDLKARPHT